MSCNSGTHNSNFFEILHNLGKKVCTEGTIIAILTHLYRKEIMETQLRSVIDTK